MGLGNAPAQEREHTSRCLLLVFRGWRRKTINSTELGSGASSAEIAEPKRRRHKRLSHVTARQLRLGALV
jgi:hypothetical protein